VLAAAVQQRLVTSADLLAVVRRFPTLPRRALILETIGDVGGGAHSLPELEWNDGIRRARLPAPTRQRKVRHANGHFYLDADFDEWLVTVEINGAQHLTATSRDLDDERRFQLSARGRLVVDIASHVRRSSGDCTGWPKPGGSRCGSHPWPCEPTAEGAAELTTVERSPRPQLAARPRRPHRAAPGRSRKLRSSGPLKGPELRSFGIIRRTGRRCAPGVSR
jgi:hypothetical protein